MPDLSKLFLKDKDLIDVRGRKRISKYLYKWLNKIFLNIRKELVNSPFQSLSNFPQTIAIVGAAIVYIRGIVAPEATVLEVPDIMIQLSGTGQFEGNVMVANDSGPSADSLSGKIFSATRYTVDIQLGSFEKMRVKSGQGEIVSRLYVKLPPEIILLCLTGRNASGVRISQKTFLEKSHIQSNINTQSYSVHYQSIINGSEKPALNCPN